MRPGLSSSEEAPYQGAESPLNGFQVEIGYGGVGELGNEKGGTSLSRGSSVADKGSEEFSLMSFSH